MMTTDTSTPKPLLEVRDLVQDYETPGATVRALDHVGLSISPGETVGLVGESGCGKSTLARAILLLRRPTSGTIRFKGADVTGLRGRMLKRHRQDVRMVFQDPLDSLDPRFSVRASLNEPLRGAHVPTGQWHERSVEALQLVGLDQDALTRQPHEFSGGQRQRISIARAIIVHPKLLILDEPTSALDVSVQAQSLNLLIDLQAQLKISYLFISHNLAVVHHMAHRIAVMNHGRIVESGTSEQLITAPKDPYTEKLLSAMPELYRS